MAVRRLYAVGFRSQALTPLRNIDLREIAAPGFSDVGFLKPFFYLAVVSHKGGMQQRLLFSPLLSQVGVHAQDFRCPDRVFKMLPDKLLVAGSAVHNRS